MPSTMQYLAQPAREAKARRATRSRCLLAVALLALAVPPTAAPAQADPSIRWVATIGDTSAGGVSYRLHLPTDVAMGDDQRLYAVSAGSHELMIFDPTGRPIGRFGSLGSGPAEFYYPYSIDIDSRGTLYVADLGNQRIQRFDREGAYQGEMPFTTGNMRINAAGEISVTRAHGDFDYAIERSDAFSRDSNIQLLTSTGEKRRSLSGKLVFGDAQKAAKGNEVHVALDGAGGAVVAYDYAELLEQFDSRGNLLWQWGQRPGSAPILPKADADRPDNLREVQMRRCHAGVAIDGRGRIWALALRRQLAEQERASTDLRIFRGFDGKKKLTITVADYQGPATVDVLELRVFSPTGELRASLPLSHFGDNLRIFDDDLLVVDTFHGQRIYHYEISD